MATPSSPIDPHDTDSELDYDEPLGSFQGVVAYSNIDDHYFSGERQIEDGIFSGYRYQCVEYARRFLIDTRGAVFGNCMRASEIFSMTEVSQLETGKTFPFIGCKNKESMRKPQPGDIIVYPYVEKKMPWGHVGVISTVADTWVGIAEQNIRSYPWKDEFGRKVPLKQLESGAWHLEEDDPDFLDCSGWMYTEGLELRDKATAGPLKTVESLKWKQEPFELSRLALPPGEFEGTSDSVKAAVALSTASKRWESTYLPCESYGICAVAVAFRGFNVVVAALKAQLAELTDAQVSAQFDLPEFLVATARRQLDNAAQNFYVGKMVYHWDMAANTHKILDVQFDELDLFAQLDMQDEIVDKGGYPGGFRNTTVKSSSGRSLRTMMRHKRRQFIKEHKGTDKKFDATLYFLDFGTTTGVSAEEDVILARHRANGVCLMEQKKVHLAEQRKDFADGELKEMDLPRYHNVHAADFFSDDVVINEATHELIIHGSVVNLAFKLAPWEVLLKMAKAGNAKVDKLLRAVCGQCCRHPVVFQPLWTYLADNTAAQKFMATWAHSTPELEAAYGKYALPPSMWEESNLVDGKPRCVRASDVKQRAIVKALREGKDSGLEGSRHVVYHSFLAGGKSGAGIFMEQHGLGADKLAAVKELTMPSALSWGLGGYGKDEEEEEEEKKE